MAEEIGLDRAPIEFWKLVFLVPPTVHIWANSEVKSTKEQTFYNQKEIIFEW